MAAGQSPLSRSRSGLALRPWQLEVTTLARKVERMGPFFLFSPEDSAQLHLRSLPGEKTSLNEAGGGRLGGFALERPQRAVFFTPERESSWTSSSICSRVWNPAVREELCPLLAIFLDGGGTERRGGLCLFPWEDVCQRFPDLYPHTVSSAHFLNIFHSDRQDILYELM